jgi:hypothetical protein
LNGVARENVVARLTTQERILTAIAAWADEFDLEPGKEELAKALASRIDETLFGSLSGIDFDDWLVDLRQSVESGDGGTELESVTVSATAIRAILARLANPPRLPTTPDD